jgi:pilus assembly protein CpaE
VPASVNRGVPIVLDDPKGAVSASIRHLAESYLRKAETDTGDEPVQAQRKTLFRGRR